MKKLVIAIDCDDVLVDTLPQVVVDYNKIYNANVELEHMYRSFDEPEVATAFGIKTQDEAIERLHDLYKQVGYYDSLLPVEGAVDAIAKLAKHHELHLVTGRQSFLEAATYRTLERYFPGAFSSVEHTNYYSSDDDTVAVKRSKAEVCLEIGADVLIDDFIVHGEGVLGAGVEAVIVFGDYPWNNAQDLMSGMIRCEDWEKVLEQIKVLDGSGSKL